MKVNSQLPTPKFQGPLWEWDVDALSEPLDQIA
jgi:hypothetical protein